MGLAYGACDSASSASARRISYLIGSDGTILKAYPKVDAAKHPEAILSDMA